MMAAVANATWLHEQAYLADLFSLEMMNVIAHFGKNEEELW